MPFTFVDGFFTSTVIRIKVEARLVFTAFLGMIFITGACGKLENALLGYTIKTRQTGCFEPLCAYSGLFLL